MASVAKAAAPKIWPDRTYMCGDAQIRNIGKDKTDEIKKAINMVPQEPIKVQEGKCWDFFVDLPEFDCTKVNKNLVKQAMLLEGVNVPAELKEKLTTQKQDDEAGLNDRTSQMQKKNSDRLVLSLMTTTQ